MDKVMNHVVMIGGISIVCCVMGIFFFVLFQIVPLFYGTSLTQETKISIASADREALVFGADEWTQLPFFIRSSGAFAFYDLTGQRPVQLQEPSMDAEVDHSNMLVATKQSQSQSKLRAAAYRQEDKGFLLAYEDGTFRFGKVEYEKVFGENESPVVEASVVVEEAFSLEGSLMMMKDLTQIAYGGEDEERLLSAYFEKQQQLVLASFTSQSASLFEGSSFALESVRFFHIAATTTTIITNAGLGTKADDFIEGIEGKLTHILVRKQADFVLLVDEAGVVHVIDPTGTVVQTFIPFDDLPDRTIGSAAFIFGDVSVSFVSGTTGDNRIYSLHAQEKLQNAPRFSRTKMFKNKPFGPITVDVYAKSTRNKTYLLGSGKTISLRHSTTEKVLLEKKSLYIEADLQRVLIGDKYNKVLFVDALGGMYRYDLQSPHPESSLRTFFSRLWYEGFSQPKYSWQSSASSEDYEPKLSMIPLLWGSLKGTLFALLFSIPIAVLSAMYVSQFLHPSVKAVIKPIMEIMASLPSVILGFIGALYIAPLIADSVPSLLLMTIGVPFLFLGMVRIGNLLQSWFAWPRWIRRMASRGLSLVVYGIFTLCFCYVCWHLGPILESVLFVVSLPGGETIGNFRIWWTQVLGFSYEQRNALVVGFTMGFCVVPIIFTIAEDAFSSVPGTLRSASLALGASRWQSAVHVVLPAAMGGIFSAIMIGFGRAVGETMIVLMATGNTPLLDINPFTGMRTLSANIAVELPEAPKHSTLYRSLFLGAFFLFVITFLINTLSEILRQRLRRQYKALE